MNKAAKKKYKQSNADSIRRLGKLLYDSGVIGDKKKFEDAYNQCLNGPIPEIAGVNIDYSKCWGYSLSNVIVSIPIDLKGNTVLPDGAKVSSISVSSTVIGNYVREDYCSDPFSHLEFNIILKGEDINGAEMVASWHLDRHLVSKKDPIHAHPIYHFQYGGKNLKLPNSNYGSHLVVDSPRIMHLPLDTVLGFDFILTNFLGDKSSDLRRNRPYVALVQTFQKAIWRPYIHSIARHWDPYEPEKFEWDNVAICPQIV